MEVKDLLKALANESEDKELMVLLRGTYKAPSGREEFWETEWEVNELDSDPEYFMIICKE